MTQTVRYPIGEQSFREIIRNGYVYVDKTTYIHKLVNENKYYFLSRPRRFGKSLLVTTMEQYFVGNRELFKGLAIDSLQPEEWGRHAVLHLDLNGGIYNNPEALYVKLNNHLDNWQSKYGCKYDSTDVASRFQGVIESAYQKTGLGVVVLIDEYDKPVIDAQDDKDLEKAYRNILRGFYGVMKIEFKLDKSPEVALQQIEDKQYDRPYRILGKPIVKVGVKISTTTRTIDSWLIHR